MLKAGCKNEKKKRSLAIHVVTMRIIGIDRNYVLTAAIFLVLFLGEKELKAEAEVKRRARAMMSFMVV
jgi:hypothetical protein